jgi:hypothetical protein
MSRRKPSIPGQLHTQFTVTVREPTGKQEKGDDGRPVRDWYASGDLESEVTYVGNLYRLDGRWSLTIQWVDLDNEGHRFAVPHAVVLGMKSALDRLMTASKSQRAQKAAETRKENLVALQGGIE